MNKTILLGHITKDMDIRYTPSGTAIARTSLATNRRTKKRDGTNKDETMFIDIIFWGRTAEIANQYLKKGSHICVEGHLTLEQWTNKEGHHRSKHAVVVETLQMLGKREKAEENKGTETQKEPEHQIPEIEIQDDEIPF